MAIRALRGFTAVALLLLLAVPPAHTAFPGKNGTIAITGIQTLNPDGSNPTPGAPAVGSFDVA
jgi:hypothetical protein